MATVTETAPLPTPEDRPAADVVIYDGHCKFCRGQVERLERWDCQGKLSFLSLHDPEVARRFPDLTHEQLMREMYVVTPNGTRLRGMDAIRYLSRRLRRLWWLMPLLHIPFSMPFWRWCYRQVANRRYLFGKVEDCDNGTCSLHHK